MKNVRGVLRLLGHAALSVRNYLNLDQHCCKNFKSREEKKKKKKKKKKVNVLR
jgi:hypothetical protein